MPFSTTSNTSVLCQSVILSPQSAIFFFSIETILQLLVSRSSGQEQGGDVGRMWPLEAVPQFKPSLHDQASSAALGN